VFEDMAGFMTADLTMTGRGEAAITHAGVVTSSFFRLTGAVPAVGRLFTEDDDRPGAAATVLLSHEFWARRLGGDPTITGSTLALDGKPYQVIGVLRPGLQFFSKPVDFYVPLGPLAGNAADRSRHASMRVLALLKPGTTLAAGRTDLDGIMQRLAKADPGPEDDHRAFAAYLSESTTRRVRPTLLVLMGASGLVLLLACANVASLLLLRGGTRMREIAVRLSIGAGRARLARQLFTENLTLAAIGGGLGVLLAGLCLRTLVLAGPPDIPRLAEAGLNVPVLLFGAAVTIAVALLAGSAPVLSASGSIRLPR
jgi:hypothetical protein